DGAPFSVSPTGAPKGPPTGAPKGHPEGVPKGPPEGAPKGLSEGAPKGPPEGAPFSYSPEGAPKGPPEGAPCCGSGVGSGGRFVVVDGSCVMFRCYHAMPTLRNREGDNVGALMGFFRSLVQIRRRVSPSHMAVVFDHPTGRSSRLAVSTSYKTHRSHPPLDFVEQMQKAKALCAALGLLPLEVEGVEGDDVIATLVDRLCGGDTQQQQQQQQQQHQQQQQQGELLPDFIATVDKDLLQLLRYNYQSPRRSPRVSLLALHRQGQLLDTQFVRDEYGVEPHQLLDFFSLVGDRADGIVGCRGIGAAAARKLLQAVESLE
ncbi:DNA polymerase I, putative, partial [Eimeria acervulina]